MGSRAHSTDEVNRELDRTDCNIGVHVEDEFLAKSRMPACQ